MPVSSPTCLARAFSSRQSRSLRKTLSRFRPNLIEIKVRATKTWPDYQSVKGYQMKHFILAGTLALIAGPGGAADQAVTYPYEGSFSDAAFAVENAIIGRGLVIDYTSHTGEMLARTGADVGSTKELFVEADIFLFCSAQLSRKVMEADPMNIAHCPYSIFVADQSGTVMIGYRTYPEGPMQEVQALLDEIVKDAME
jgi:uncharacterized protein (DUF302 family)